MNSTMQPANLYSNYHPPAPVAPYYYYPAPDMSAIVPTSTTGAQTAPGYYVPPQQAQPTPTGDCMNPQVPMNIATSGDNASTTGPPSLPYATTPNCNATLPPFQSPPQMYPQPYAPHLSNDFIHPTPPQHLPYPLPITQPSQIPQYYPAMPMMIPAAQYGVGGLPPDPNMLSQPAKAVEHFRFGSLQPSKGKLPPLSSVSKTNLYLSGLGEKVTDATLYSLVEKVVKPKSCKALLSADGKCNGIGFIDCLSEEDARLAQQHIEKVVNSFIHGDNKDHYDDIDFREIVREGRVLEVKFAHENAKDVCNIYVRNLPKDNFTNDDLKNLFSQYGHVISVKLLSSQFNGCQTGIGFVRMSTETDARRAIEAVNRAHVTPRGSDMPLRCQLADKSDRRSMSTSTPMNNNKSSRRFSAGNIGCTDTQPEFSSSHGSRSDVDLISQSMSQMHLMSTPVGSKYPIQRIASPYQQMMTPAQHAGMMVPGAFIQQGTNPIGGCEAPRQSPKMNQSPSSSVAQGSRASTSPLN